MFCAISFYFQVILGRSTDEMQVDIDLGIEGPANKISRRQVRFLRSFGCKILLYGLFC